MRRLLPLVAVLAVAAVLGVQPAAATTAPPNPSPSPSPADIAAAQQQALLDAVKARLGDNLANALAAQEQLTQSLRENAAEQSATSDRIVAEQDKVAQLDAELKALENEIAATQKRITIERAQLRSLARALYEQPSSLLVSLAEANGLGDLLTRAADLGSAANRANELKAKLAEDEKRLAAAQERKQSDLDKETAIRDALVADLAALKSLQGQQEKSKADLQTKVAQTRYELSIVDGQSADLAAKITQLLQDEQDQIIAAAMQQVWDQYRLWAGSNSNALGGPTSPGHSTRYRFIWPEPKAAETQPFGPSNLGLEPPFAGYPHFHIGIDLVEPYGSQVLAADDGVVAQVGSTQYGYGNYVILAHAGGLSTMYAHLASAVVKVGDKVSQGQPVGLEGSSGTSTGAHLHFELRADGKPIDPSIYLPPGAPSAYNY